MKANQLSRKNVFILVLRTDANFPNKNDTVKYIETHPQREKKNLHSKPSNEFHTSVIYKIL